MFNLCELLHQHDDEPKEKTKKVMLRDAVAKVTVMAAVTTQEAIQVLESLVAYLGDVSTDRPVKGLRMKHDWRDGD